MSNPSSAIDAIRGYHAHVYFRDDGEREQALALRDRIGAAFEARLGRVWDKPVGPHPIPMYQVVFSTDQFATLVPFLMLERDGLSVLVHPETGDDVADHSAHALWLGAPLPLDLEILRRPTGD
jgi:DOPA 4,5-dioxygenase